MPKYTLKEGTHSQRIGKRFKHYVKGDQIEFPDEAAARRFGYARLVEAPPAEDAPVLVTAPASVIPEGEGTQTPAPAPSEPPSEPSKAPEPPKAPATPAEPAKAPAWGGASAAAAAAAAGASKPEPKRPAPAKK